MIRQFKSIIINNLQIILFTIFFSRIFIRECFSQPRISGGEEGSIEDWPYVLSIQVSGELSDSEHHCAATIYSPNYAITAAHCM